MNDNSIHRICKSGASLLLERWNLYSNGFAINRFYFPFSKSLGYYSVT